MPAGKLTVAAALGGLLVCFVCPSAHAYTGATATPTDGGGGQVGAVAGTPPAATLASSGGATCSYEVLNHPNDPGTPSAGAQPAPTAVEYVRTCPGGAVTIVWVVPPTGADAVPAALADVQRLLPKPQPSMVPPNNDPRGWAYVRTPLWWWVPASSWHPVSATASVTSGPFTVSATVTATPTTLVFNPGDGVLGSGQVTCPGPGVPFDNALSLAVQSSPCTYTYTNASSLSPSGTWAATFTTVWHVAWVGSDGTGGVLANLSTGTQHPLAVGEVQSLGSNTA